MGQLRVRGLPVPEGAVEPRWPPMPRQRFEGRPAPRRWAAVLAALIHCPGHWCPPEAARQFLRA
eukprot:10950686-Alexandrium_andersonii.AAC.1